MTILRVTEGCYQFGSLLRLAKQTMKKQKFFVFILILLVTLLVLLEGCQHSSSDSSSTTPAINDANADPSEDDDIQDDDVDNTNDKPILQVYSEIGAMGMQMTYSPSTLTSLTSVEEMESTFESLMSCAGVTAEFPAILLTNDDEKFSEGQDLRFEWAHWDVESQQIVVHSSDLLTDNTTRLWWTRDGMIQYLKYVHDLTGNNQFFDCHWVK